MRFGRNTTILTEEDAELDALLATLYHPKLKAIDPDLARIQKFLALVGNPERRMPPAVHVAGTNGKGSLLAFLQAMLEAAGYRVHRYTSPHLVRFNERIVLAGQEIETAKLLSLLRAVKARTEEVPLTFFEATTVAAFLAFAETPADIVLLETGMGGRLDATNVLEKPLLTAITPISHDHGEFLGATIAAIAGEKAGILKAGVPCVVGPQSPEAIAVIERTASQLSAPLRRYGREWEVLQKAGSGKNGSYIYRSAAGEMTLPTLPLPGAHQYANAGAALACLEALPDFTVSGEAIQSGLASARWPARLQRLEGGRLNTLLPAGMELWLDGGHNPGAGEVLAEWLRAQSGKTIALCAMLSGKDVPGFLRPVAPYLAHLYAVPIAGEPKSQPPAALAGAAEAVGIAASASVGVEAGLAEIAAAHREASRVLICGSLYLAGQVLALQSGAVDAATGMVDA